MGPAGWSFTPEAATLACVGVVISLFKVLDRFLFGFGTFAAADLYKQAFTGPAQTKVPAA